jgi:hypothetical protein
MHGSGNGCESGGGLTAKDTNHTNNTKYFQRRLRGIFVVRRPKLNSSSVGAASAEYVAPLELLILGAAVLQICRAYGADEVGRKFESVTHKSNLTSRHSAATSAPRPFEPQRTRSVLAGASPRT